MDELKPCPFCERPLYIKVTRYLRPILAPLTHADALRDELINITGEDFAPINAEYCPMCGRPLNRRAATENKPLTLDRLRQMDGKPVKVYEDGEYQYGLVSLSGHFLAPKEEVITLCSGDFYLLREMVGNFEVYPVACARKPEQEDKP